MPARAAVLERLSAARFLADLSNPARPPIASDAIAIVLAHPDDETIGCGAQLPRLKGATLVLVTDGSPENLADAQANGFESREAYAEARRQELACVLAVAGMPTDALHELAIGDQRTPFHLVELSRKLADLFERRGISLVLTHAYEGGHPDHDATAFAVHAAARLLARVGRPFEIVEMPLYHAGRDGWCLQAFAAGPSAPAVEIVLSERERALKQSLVAAHATQSAVLAGFSVDVERFRLAPPYAFLELPNGGALLYERYDWGMTGERWRALVTAALAEIGLEAQA